MSLIDRLTDELARLPGIGRKTALRLTYHLLKTSPEDADRLAEAIVAVARGVHACPRCGNYTEHDICEICRSPRRDQSLLCVVEEPADIGAIERTGEYQGLYHVLGGRLSPLDGIGPDQLNVASLLDRLGEGTPVREVVLATNASVEGEATTLYLHRLIAPRGIRVTRLARGLPVGGDLEYADGVTIVEALHGRREL
ncbi:MAG TPA: recombination mediator RecR [Longimicrobiaceae bacterium]